MTTLISYSQEIQPLIRALLQKQETLKEWAAEDSEVLKQKEAIKESQEILKQYIESKESELVQEINALSTDIKLACKAAAKGSPYKAADLKAFFTARAKEAVDKVVDKGDLFFTLNKELK